MKTFLKLFVALVLVLSVASCKKQYEELQNNPNQPVSLPPALILGKELNDLNGGLGGAEPWGAVHRYNQFYCRNYQYYGDNSYNFTNGPFGVYSSELKNIEQMEEEATKLGGDANNPFAGVAKFLKAYYYYNMTSLMGDVPMKEALKGLTNINGPQYDTQKEVFLQIFKWLDEANDIFTVTKGQAPNRDFNSNDIIYNGNYGNWQKAVNALKLRVLVSLSKKAADADLRVGQRFNEVLSNTSKYPLFTGMADNFSYKYNNDFNRYPLNPSNFGFDALRLNVAETWVKNLTQLNDPRVFATCEPAYKIVDNNTYALTDFRAFVAAPTGENQTDMENKVQGGLYSLIGRYRYYRGFVAEPNIILGYAEQCFNIAEGLNRGWSSSGNAETNYRNGIQAMMSFYDIKDGANTFYFLRSGSPTALSAYQTANYSFNFNSYYSQTSVSYEANAAGLAKIHLQKYLSFFMNSGWEAFFNQRRTGVPTFSVGAGIGNGGILPKRWSYPVSEQNVNGVNWKTAVDRQFSGQETPNGNIWMNQ